MGEMTILSKWTEEVLAHVYKKGSQGLVLNYGDLSLTDSGYKIITDILREKLLIIISEENIYRETQFCFHKGM